MSLHSPGWLLLLVPLALLIGAYLLVQRRRGRYAVRFTNLELLDKVAPRRPGWRRHVPAAAFCGTLALLVVGFARPTTEVQVPRERATIVVAFDVSASMEATDVEPTRFEAAQSAALAFVDQLPERFNAGLVPFSGSATVAVPPTTDRGALRSAIERLTTGEGTAIGEAVVAARDAVRMLDREAETKPPPAHIVLLSDGSNTTGRSVESAAREAAGDKIPVSTIAYGTESGTIDLPSGDTVSVPVDGPALRGLASSTGGDFHEAATGEELQEVYEDIGSSVGHRTEEREIWQWFVAAGLLTALATAATSLLWFSRLP
ncbi:Ca-activated chloride channel family protein [Streptomyces umbrinus]|uniref:VWA domain-containing protein n=1 Tax=Streptomyces umbrinus TaxID=67370 RepID=UPI00167C8086|nr:VWA domain-containing protein [Streptomyces umbrinus]MCR3728510.1 Ca-activated chloride channel family protein [Streptomyces umbrinus]GHH46978.1 membrane protein [Streptomyces umbrinus]